MLALARQLKLANIFWAYVLARNIRYQQDLVDQHCNPSEKRLARILLLLAHYDGHGGSETTLPKIGHETLAEMVGTTRSRICFFMNKFKEAGFIYYGHKDKLLRVHRTLLAFLQPIALRSQRSVQFVDSFTHPGQSDTSFRSHSMKQPQALLRYTLPEITYLQNHRFGYISKMYARIRSSGVAMYIGQALLQHTE